MQITSNDYRRTKYWPKTSKKLNSVEPNVSEVLFRELIEQNNCKIKMISCTQQFKPSQCIVVPFIEVDLNTKILFIGRGDETLYF